MTWKAGKVMLQSDHVSGQYTQRTELTSLRDWYRIFPSTTLPSASVINTFWSNPRVFSLCKHTQQVSLL